ncbi:hypothetical protein EV178_002219, partial [Coemansia sp. RSA 1646]
NRYLGPHEDALDDIGDTMQDMVVFGYSARIFSETEVPCGSRVGLIQLEPGNFQGAAVYVDRYDIRHLILPSGASKSNAGDEYSKRGDFDALRFSTLRSLGDNGAMSEIELFGMDPEERRAYIDYLSHPAEQGSSARHQESQVPSGSIMLQYDASGNPMPTQMPKNGDDSKGNGHDEETGGRNRFDDKPFAPSFTVPEGIATPKTQRHFEIVERTARFLADQQDAEKAAQMEVMIQGKQGTNADFEFLNRASQLHPFYKHILWLMRTGLYGYNDDSSSESDSGTEESNDSDSASHLLKAISKAEDQGSYTVASSNVCVPDGVVVPADSNTRSFVDKVACMVGRSPSPARMEQNLRVKKATTSSTYAFLSPFDAANKYYCFRRDCYMHNTDESAVEKAVSKALNEAQAPPESELPKEAESTALMQAKRRMLALEFLKGKRPKSQEE